MSAAVQAPTRPAVYPRAQTDSPQFTAAHSYAARGWPVFPCRFRSKDPATTHGFKDASTDPATIRAMWPRGPANVAIAIPPGVVAIDFDVHPDQGQDGRPWYEAHPELFPPTLCMRTSNGGSQRFYSVPPDAPIRQVDLAPGVQVRAPGKGYSMAPPSIHPSGYIYQWADGAGPDEYPVLTPAPWPLLALLTTAPAPMPAAPAETPQRTLDPQDRPTPATLVQWGIDNITRYGGRDNTGFRLACQVLANGYDGYDGERIMLDYAGRVPSNGADAYTPADARRNWRSAHNYPILAPWERGARRPAVEDTTPPPADVNGVIADVDPGAVDWQNLIAEIAALRLELQEERAARLAAEARARYLYAWHKVPNVLAGIRDTAPLVAQEYQNRQVCGQTDADGWAMISTAQIAAAMMPGLPDYDQRTEAQHKAVSNRAEQIKDYIGDMAAHDWIECKHGDWIGVNGHVTRRLYIRPKVEAFLTDPLALPVPDKKRPRPVKLTCPNPACQSERVRQVVLCQCLACGEVFQPPPADDAPAASIDADTLEKATAVIAALPPPTTRKGVETGLAAWRPAPVIPTPVDREISGLPTVDLEPENFRSSVRIGGVASAAAGAPSLRIAADAARELQGRAVTPPADAYIDLFDDPILAPAPPDAPYCWQCEGPCTGTCDKLPNAPRRAEAVLR